MDSISDSDKALVMSLVHRSICDDKTSMVWVPSYTVVRTSRKPRSEGPLHTFTTVGSHYRRKPQYKQMLDALERVCVFERLSAGPFAQPPLGVARRRWNEDGTIVPVNDRRYEFF